MLIRGVNHLAMVTGNLDETVRFYRDVLEMDVVATTGNRPGSYPYRHYFFKIGEHTTLAFFEWPGGMVQKFHKPAGLPARGPWQFDHLSFDVPDDESLLKLRERLEKHGVEVTPVVDHQFIQSIYFSDPNGIALEASYWVKDATMVDEVDTSDRFLFGDPDPVPALKEQAAVPSV